MSMNLSNKKIVGAVLCGLAAAFWIASEIVAPPKAAGQAPPSGALFMTNLFEQVRIPKITVTQSGSLLAFADGCRLLRRSENRGNSWSEPAVVNPGGRGGVVVDAQSGDVLIVCPPLSYLLRSRDDGKTWSKEEIEIKPNAAEHGVPGGVQADVVCSESGVSLEYGEHKGRLVMPARIQPPHGDNAQEYWQYNYNTSLYSDDGGKTWQVGEPVQSGTGEGTLAELSDGRLYYNSRSHMSVDHRRRIAWSYDGGRRWVDWSVSDDLFEVGGPHYFKYGRKPSYGCNAGLVRLPLEASDNKDVLVFSTPDNPGATSPHNGRVRMTVWASLNGGENWPHKRLVYDGVSSYSSLAAGRDGSIYLLFESGEEKLYEKITFARFDLNWILEGDSNRHSK